MSDTNSNTTYLTTRKVDRIGSYILLGVGAVGCIFGAQLLLVPIFYVLYVPFATAAIVGLLRLFIRPRFGKFYFAPGTAVGLIEVIFGDTINTAMANFAQQSTGSEMFMPTFFGLIMFQLVGWGMIISGGLRTLLVNLALRKALNSEQVSATEETEVAPLASKLAAREPKSDAISE